MQNIFDKKKKILVCAAKSPIIASVLIGIPMPVFKVARRLERKTRMNIYAGNLSRDVTEDDLRQAFEAFGQVESVTIIKDRFTGEARGFGFIEMPSKDEAQTAISQMNGKNLRGQAIKVSEAQARKEDSRGGEGRPRQGGGGGGGRRRF